MSKYAPDLREEDTDAAIPQKLYFLSNGAVEELEIDNLEPPLVCDFQFAHKATGKFIIFSKNEQIEGDISGGKLVVKARRLMYDKKIFCKILLEEKAGNEKHGAVLLDNKPIVQNPSRVVYQYEDTNDLEMLDLDSRQIIPKLKGVKESSHMSNSNINVN
jgi:hypothetical protein